MPSCLRRSLLCWKTLALFPILFLSASLWAQSKSVVISQIYGGGGNSTPTAYDSDFIELFNLSGSPVNMNGWSVQYTPGTSATTSVAVTAVGNITLQPGQFFLIKEATGTTCTTKTSPACPTFTGDVTGTINLSGTTGKVFLVSSTTPITYTSVATGGSVTTCPVTAPAGASIIDYVGFGGASCAEGAKATPAISGNAQSAIRTNACTDTDNNGNDFSVSTNVVPRNTTTTATPCSSVSNPTAPTIAVAASPSTQTSGQAVLLTAVVTPGTSPASTGINVTADLSGVGGSATQPLNDSGTNGDVTANDGTYSYSYTIPAGQASNTYSITFAVADSQTRSATAKANVTVTQPVSFVPIHTIQGSMGTGATAPAASKYVGQVVQTSGIVIGVLSNGYYIQARDNAGDGDPTTPEGIFVHTGTGSVPATATIGTEVQVSGTVQSYPSGTGLTLAGTELDGVTGYSVLSSSNPLPAAIALTTTLPSPTGGPYQLMRYQSMRVSVPSFTATEGTQGALSEKDETYTSNGQFYGTVTGVARPVREPGLEVLDPLTLSYPNIPKFDDNPEVFAVDSLDMVGNANPIDLATGAVLTNMTGVMDFSGLEYSVGGGSGAQLGAGPVFVLDATNRPTVTGGMTVVTVPAAAAGELTIGDQNMERFYSAAGGTSGAVVVTQAAYALRLQKASLAIRNVLGTPDVLCLEEMENLAALTDLSTQISQDAVAAGQTDPAYAPYLVQGNDTSGINVAFLVKPSRVDVIDVTQFGKDTTFTNSTNTQPPPKLNDRPPLVMHLGVKRAIPTDYPLTVIVNHLRSLNGVTDNTTSGQTVRIKREKQAEYLANLIQGYQAKGEHVISVGDYNAFEFNDGVVDSMDIVRGVPTNNNQDIVPGPANPIVTPALVDLAPTSAASNTYSYVYVGNAQSIDHVFATSDIAGLMRTSAAHYNADFPVIYRNSATRPEAGSDHDGIVAYLAVPPGTFISVTPSSLTYANTQPLNTPSASQPVTVKNTGTSPITFTSIVTSTGFTQTNNCGTSLAGGASCTVNVVFQPTVTGPQTGTLTLTDSDATLTQKVALSGTGAGIFSAIMLTVNPNAAVAGANVALTATLSGNSTNPPSGMVTFSSNGTSVGTATAANGVATLNIKSLPVGTDSITATYNGDSVYPSISTTTPVTVTITPAPVPDFTFAIANTAINVSNNAKSGSATLNVAFLNGFSQTVSFSCTGLPANSHCNFAPPTLSASGSTVLTVTIDKAALESSPLAPLEKGSGIVLAGLFLPLLFRRSVRAKLRGYSTVLGAVLLGLMLTALAGCGGNANTPTGTSTLTVVATAGGVSHNATVTLNVQ